MKLRQPRKHVLGRGWPRLNRLGTELGGGETSLAQPASTIVFTHGLVALCVRCTSSHGNNGICAKLDRQRFGPPLFIQELLPKQSVNDFSCGLSSLLRIRCRCRPAPPTGTVGVHLNVHSRTLSDRCRCDSASSHCSLDADFWCHVLALDEGHILHECCRTVG